MEENRIIIDSSFHVYYVPIYIFAEGNVKGQLGRKLAMLASALTGHIVTHPHLTAFER